MQEPADTHGHAAGMIHYFVARKHNLQEESDIGASTTGVRRSNVSGRCSRCWSTMSVLVPVRVPAYAATASHSYFHVLSVLMHVLLVCVYIPTVICYYCWSVFGGVCVCQMFLRLDLVLSVQMLGLRWHSLTDPMLGCHATCLPLASVYFCVDPSPKQSLLH